MQLTDRQHRPGGVLDLTVYRSGQVFERWRDDNLVVDGARQMLAELVAGDGAGESITQIGFGTSDTPATPDDTSLTAAYVRNLVDHSYPEPGQVQFEFALNTSEANGITIKEFGLITSSGALFSRKVRGGIEKNDDISLAGVWTITF